MGVHIQSGWLKALTHGCSSHLPWGRLKSVSGTSGELPGYELVTGASLGMSAPWSACVMPGEVRLRQRGRIKCFLYTGPGSTSGSHDPEDCKQHAVGRGIKLSPNWRAVWHPSQAYRWGCGPWMGQALPPPSPGLGWATQPLEMDLESQIRNIGVFDLERTLEIIQPLAPLCRIGNWYPWMLAEPESSPTSCSLPKALLISCFFKPNH